MAIAFSVCAYWRRAEMKASCWCSSSCLLPRTKIWLTIKTGSAGPTMVAQKTKQFKTTPERKCRLLRRLWLTGNETKQPKCDKPFGFLFLARMRDSLCCSFLSFSLSLCLSICQVHRNLIRLEALTFEVYISLSHSNWCSTGHPLLAIAIRKMSGQ